MPFLHRVTHECDPPDSGDFFHPYNTDDHLPGTIWQCPKCHEVWVVRSDGSFDSNRWHELTSRQVRRLVRRGTIKPRY